jgi:RimJ/RimL family protein N-acetyltransferase
MRLETERLIFRPFEERDVEPLAAINSDPEVMRFFEHPLTREETLVSIQRSHDGIRHNGFHFVAAELKSSGEFAGILGIARFDDETRTAIPTHPPVEIGWRLARQLWGQGLAPEGARACLDFAWVEMDLPEIVAITAEINGPSRRVMEKIGMVRDSEADFDHPKVAPSSPLRRHVLYRIGNPNR